MLKRISLWLQIIFALVLGVLGGFLLSPEGGFITQAQMQAIAPWIGLPGNLFLALVKMIMLPLVFASIILGITSSDDKAFLRRAAARILPYFILTTIIAVTLGATVASVFKPGKHIDQEQIAKMMEGNPAAENPRPVEAPEEEVSLPDRIVQLIPTNYIQSQLDQDVLAIVILGMFIGTAMVVADPEEIKPLRGILIAVQAVSLKIVDWAMLLAPLAVFSMICRIVMRVGLDAVTGMAVYMGSVIFGLVLLMVFYLLVVFFLGRRSPLAFLRQVYNVQLLAFSTSSSAAVMPLSMQTAEEKLGADKSISQFIVPLGATINMDGTALYQVCATVFLTQVYGIELGLGGLLAVAATTVGASIGTPSTPGVGIIVLATILQGVGVPASGVALILGVDRLIDMCRTSVNVTGDLVAVTVMDLWLAGVKPEASTTVEGNDAAVSA